MLFSVPISTYSEFIFKLRLKNLFLIMGGIVNTLFKAELLTFPKESSKLRC